MKLKTTVEQFDESENFKWETPVASYDCKYKQQDSSNLIAKWEVRVNYIHTRVVADFHLPYDWSRTAIFQFFNEME